MAKGLPGAGLVNTKAAHPGRRASPAQVPDTARLLAPVKRSVRPLEQLTCPNNLSKTITCQCAFLGETTVGDMTADLPNPRHRVLAERGRPWWWLYASLCEHCGQHWLVAQEEGLNDVLIMRKLSSEESRGLHDSGVWPAYFDQYETLLRLGAEAGHHARYADTTNHILQAIVEDLTRDRPDISVEEIATLLNIPVESAAILVRAVASQSGESAMFEQTTNGRGA